MEHFKTALMIVVGLYLIHTCNLSIMQDVMGN
jgi:hypothetical protein